MNPVEWLIYAAAKQFVAKGTACKLVPLLVAYDLVDRVEGRRQ